MKRSLQQPCEEAIWNILPYIRAGLAKELQNLGLTQQSIAEKLGLTQAAVSQYINGKRARSAELDEHTSRLIKGLARDIKEEEVTRPSGRICQICTHINNNPELLRNCGVEEENLQETSPS